MNHRFCTYPHSYPLFYPRFYPHSYPQFYTSSHIHPRFCTSSYTTSCTLLGILTALLDILGILSILGILTTPLDMLTTPLDRLYNYNKDEYKTFILHDKSKLPPISEVIFPYTWKYSDSLDSKLNKYIEDNFTNGSVKYFDVDSIGEYAKYIYITSALTNKPLYRPEYIPVAMANESIVVLYCEENSEIYHMDLSKIEWPESIPTGLFEALMEKAPSYYSRKVCTSRTVVYGSALLHCASVAGILVLLYSLF